jgi:hypothetical protein
VTYCTTGELKNLTGSTLTDAILTAIIEQGDREIDAYLAPYGVGADASACKSASLELAKAGLIDYSVQHGDRADMLTAGNTTETLNVDQMIRRYRAAAFDLLDRYVSAASASISKYHVVKVVGR